MIVETHSITLISQAKVAVAATLHDEIFQEHLARQLSEWRPYLGQYGGDDGDGDWSWKDLKEEIERDQKRSWSFAIEAEGKLQGLMLAYDGLETNLGEDRPLLYVAFLATAPWNRHDFDRAKHPDAPGSIGGVGKAFIMRALAESLEQGWGGRLGLHSLPGALEFYLQKCHFTYIGKKARVVDQDYAWCELPDVAADYLRAKSQQRSSRAEGIA